jgi:hypothetical protein
MESTALPKAQRANCISPKEMMLAGRAALQITHQNANCISHIILIAAEKLYR